MKKIACLFSAALVMSLLGCGSDDKTSADQTSKFLGTWTYSGGQINVTCPGIQIPPLPLANQSFTIAAGTDSALSRKQETCELKIDVNGDVASARANQSCPLALTIYNMPVMGTLSVVEFRLTTTDGKTATTDGTGKISGMIMGFNAECPITEMGTMYKGTPDGGAGSDGAADTAPEAPPADTAGAETAAGYGAVDGGAVDSIADAGASDGG